MTKSGPITPSHRKLANQLVKWLSGKKCNCTDVKPVIVTIRGTRWIGAEYTQEQIPAAHPSRRIYCIGELPKCYQRSDNVCFTIPVGEPTLLLKEVWYIGCYWPAKSYGKQLRVLDAETDHTTRPFGANFILMQWPTTHGSIDDGERFPHKRFPLSVEPFPEST